MLPIGFTVLTALPALIHAQAAAPAHKLIEFGWDEPDAYYTRQHVAEMEKAPFDGIVLSAIGWDHGQRIDFQEEAWGKRAFNQEQFKDCVEDLRATSFHKFTDNFIRFDVTPGDVDWFDDDGWRAILNNGALAAWICKEGGLTGMMFDTEQYKAQPFNYAQQASAGTYTFAEYQIQARDRGRELAEAMVAIKPDITILFTYATSGVPVDADLPHAPYGLLPAFIDGMLEGAGQHATVVDALEKAYTAKTAAALAGLRKLVRNARALSDAPRTYDARMTVGFGIWLDCDWRDRGGWHPDTLAGAYFKPAELEKALTAALAATDKYVWLYSEQVNWWTGKGVTPAYIQAVASARQTAGQVSRR